MLSDSDKLWFHYAGGSEPFRLEDFVHYKLQETWRDVYPEDFSKSKTRKLILSGNVFINKRAVKIPAWELIRGDKVLVYTNQDQYFGNERMRIQEMRKSGTLTIPILYEDEAILLISKPVGIPTQPTLDKTRPSVYSLLKDQRAPHYVGLHHRLDRDTSGVMLFTAHEDYNKRVADLFSKHGIQKTYWAICAAETEMGQGRIHRFTESIKVQTGPLEAQYEFHQGYLKKDHQKNRMIFVRAGGDASETYYRILGAHGKFCLVEALPKTGRTHQIRATMAQLGLPLVGDGLYGSSVPAKNFFLHAKCLEFKHPATGQMVRFEAPLSGDFLKCIQQYQIPIPEQLGIGSKL